MRQNSQRFHVRALELHPSFSQGRHQQLVEIPGAPLHLGNAFAKVCSHEHAFEPVAFRAMVGGVVSF
jgi:hypothetical protein